MISQGVLSFRTFLPKANPSRRDCFTCSLVISRQVLCQRWCKKAGNWAAFQSTDENKGHLECQVLLWKPPFWGSALAGGGHKSSSGQNPASTKSSWPPNTGFDWFMMLPKARLAPQGGVEWHCGTSYLLRFSVHVLWISIGFLCCNGY